MHFITWSISINIMRLMHNVWVPDPPCGGRSLGAFPEQDRFGSAPQAHLITPCDRRDRRLGVSALGVSNEFGDDVAVIWDELWDFHYQFVGATCPHHTSGTLSMRDFVSKPLFVDATSLTHSYFWNLVLQTKSVSFLLKNQGSLMFKWGTLGSALHPEPTTLGALKPPPTTNQQKACIPAS